MSSLITAKQHIYQRMVMKITDYRALASVEALSTEDRDWLKDLAMQADLLHGIPWAITCPDITGEDVVFLNRHARHYLSSSRRDQPNYHFFKLMIYQLFTLVATQRRSELQWPGPTLDEEERRMLEPDVE